MDPANIIRMCFALIVVIGIGCIFVGPALDAAYPHVKLEHVLGSDELADQATHERTLDILKRGSRTDWPVWMLLGAILFAIGFVGLRAGNTGTGLQQPNAPHT